MRGLLLTLSMLLATASLGGASLAVSPWLGDLEQLAASTCTQAGQTICNDDCDQVILCVADGNGGFEQVVLEKCAGDARCSAEQETCVSGSTTCGADTSGGMACSEKGIFPDPLNCTVYHICYGAHTQSFPYSCPSGYAYNALTTDCSYDTTDPVCTEGPTPPCEEVGQSGPLDTNPSIYYVCVIIDGVLTPSLYKCHHGQVYDPSEPGCVNSTNANPTPGSTEAPSSPTPGSTEAPSSPTPGGHCSPPLVVAADPEDCTRYYKCSPHYKWLHVYCNHGYYFNPENKRCEKGSC